MRLTFNENWVADEGWPVLAIAGAVTVFLVLFSDSLGAFALGLMLWLRYILRVPHHCDPENARAIVSPVEGCVVDVQLQGVNVTSTDIFMPELDGGHRITIRTGLADAQLQRSPVAGRVSDNLLIPGRFRKVGNMEKARRDNERREITIQTASGASVLVVQIGTRTARNLVCGHGSGTQLERGDPLGMARIAGVTEILLPAGCDVGVLKGQRVIAGESVIAQWAGKDV